MHYENFNPHTLVVANKLFLSQFMHFLEYNNLNVRVDKELFEENLILKTLDKIFSTQSTLDFIKSIETHFAELFNAERCNVVLVHRFKKYLFRLVKESEEKAE